MRGSCFITTGDWGVAASCPLGIRPSGAVEKLATDMGGRLVSWAPGDWIEVVRAPPLDRGVRAIPKRGSEVAGPCARL